MLLAEPFHPRVRSARPRLSNGWSRSAPAAPRTGKRVLRLFVPSSIARVYRLTLSRWPLDARELQELLQVLDSYVSPLRPTSELVYVELPPGVPRGYPLHPVPLARFNYYLCELSPADLRYSIAHLDILKACANVLEPLCVGRGRGLGYLKKEGEVEMGNKRGD